MLLSKRGSMETRAPSVVLAEHFCLTASKKLTFRWKMRLNEELIIKGHGQCSGAVVALWFFSLPGGSFCWAVGFEFLNDRLACIVWSLFCMDMGFVLVF